MNLTQIVGLLGGLALFLYGMKMMSTGLEMAAGNKMKAILEKLTANRFVGVLVGAVITAIIQSSSATTVMVVGFVNSGMMTLNQAIWIIMGANIGTTITGQLIALDVGELAPMLAFLGVAMVVFLKNEKVKHIGEIMAGLGVLFIGMDMMGTTMTPLAKSDAFVGLLTKFENPFLGIMAGTVFTALIQSSSASVGILQALAGSGVIGLKSAAFVLFGQNIGTCITAFLASIGTSRNAKRTTVIHILFNVIGTIVFTILCVTTPLILFVEGLTPDNAPAQIANLHTMFNIVTTILLLPVGTWLGRLATIILRDKDDEVSEGMHTQYLVEMSHSASEKLGTSAIFSDVIKKELERMLSMARDNVNDAFDAVTLKSQSLLKTVQDREEYVDYLNKEIAKYITAVLPSDNTHDSSRQYHAFYLTCGNIERISDHAMNIAEYLNMMENKNVVFSETVEKELLSMKQMCIRLFGVLAEHPENYRDWKNRISDMEQEIDDMTDRYRENMFTFIHSGKSSDEGSILFSEMLTDFERIGDHALNIAKDIAKIHM